MSRKVKIACQRCNLLASSLFDTKINISSIEFLRKDKSLKIQEQINQFRLIEIEGSYGIAPLIKIICS